MISSLVDEGEIWRTPSRIVTERAVGIVSAEAHAPAMHEAPSSTMLRATLTAGVGKVSLSSWMMSTV